MIELRPMTLFDVFAVIPWRNASRAYLRTPTDDTRWSQFKFYCRVILNPFSPHRYRSVYRDGRLVGMVGLCYATSRQAEISLITDPERRGQGIGRAAVEATLDEAFGTLGLTTVWGEVFVQNDAVTFWQKLVTPDNWIKAVTTRGGRLCEAYWFQWTADQWRERRAA